MCLLAANTVLPPLKKLTDADINVLAGVEINKTEYSRVDGRKKEKMWTKKSVDWM